MSIDRMRVEAVGLLQDLGWMWTGSVWAKTGINKVDTEAVDRGPVVSMTEAIQAVARGPITHRDMYLGDGVYAGFTGGGELVLSTDREEGAHVIYLDSMALNHLFALELMGGGR